MSEFTEFLTDVFREFGEIQTRKMFGGYGVYYLGIMFALVADDILYLKADAETATLFEERDLSRFEYDRAGKTIQMSYYQAPEEIYDDPGEAEIWARRAYCAAVASKGSRKNGSTRRKRK